MFSKFGDLEFYLLFIFFCWKYVIINFGIL